MHLLMPVVFQIDFCCKVINSQNIAEFEMDEGGLFINDVYLQGADWNYQYDRLAESRSELCSYLSFIKFICLYFKVE